LWLCRTNEGIAAFEKHSGNGSDLLHAAPHLPSLFSLCLPPLHANIWEKAGLTVNSGQTFKKVDDVLNIGFMYA
jgi:hypothetical protein